MRGEEVATIRMRKKVGNTLRKMSRKLKSIFIVFIPVDIYSYLKTLNNVFTC